MKTRYRSVASLFASVLIAMLITVPAQAQEEKEFAEHKFVLQISDMDPAKQTIVLNVANNIMKHYGPDNAEVEIVAFGPGFGCYLKKTPTRAEFRASWTAAAFDSPPAITPLRR